MNYYFIKPEVAGGWGERTQVDRCVDPPRVIKLHYEFEGWLGDVLLESFPCFIITKEVSERIQERGATGVEFDEVEVSTSHQFRELHPSLRLPSFVWLKPEGRVGMDDFGLDPNRGLIVSERVLSLLKRAAVKRAAVAHASIDPYIPS